MKLLIYENPGGTPENIFTQLWQVNSLQRCKYLRGIFENPLAKPIGKFSNQLGASLAKGWLKSAPFWKG